MNLSFAAITDPDAFKRKMLAFFLALSVAGSASAAELTGPRLAEVNDLNARLLGHDSATAVLSAWCRDHHLAADPTIRAERDASTKTADPEILTSLGVNDPTNVRYRRVRLMCGMRTLSEADNWYRVDVLTPEMNQALETTRTPFGVVVAQLGFRRRTISAVVLPDGSGTVLRHRAILSTAGGVPFSVVTESYTDAVLGDLDVNR